jgi:hypothetical protein
MGANRAAAFDPMTVCLVVLGRHVPQLQFLNVMLGNEPVLTPVETFYQRILANDPEEATEQAEEFAKNSSLTEFFDEVAIPALARAQADSDRGVLSFEDRATFESAIASMVENLLDDDNTSSPPEHAAGPKAEDLSSIICVAGRNELDEAAAVLLMNVLRLERHIDIGSSLSADALSADTAYLSLFKKRLRSVSVADQHQFTGARALPGETYSPARPSGANIGRVLGIAQERGCGRGDGARDLRPGCGIFPARRRRYNRLCANDGEGTIT